MNRHPIRTTDGRIVATVEDGVLRKFVKGSIHKLRKPPAWAWDKTIINEAVDLGAGRIEVYDSETTITYSISLTEFQRNAFAVDRGHNPQLAVVESHWRQAKEGWQLQEHRHAVQLGLPWSPPERDLV